MEEGPEIDIEKMAELSRIRLTAEERAALKPQVAEILAFFEKLQEVDVTGIRPMAHPFESEPPLREDLPGEAWEPERALANAPAARDNQIVVPKVVEDA